MRRTALILSIGLLLAACSGTDGATDTTAGAELEPIPKTTATTATTTTTTTTTTIAESGAPSFETVTGTPPDVFDSFFSTMSITMELDDVTFSLTADGVWDSGSFECTVVTDVGGFGVEQGIVATTETLWLDSGNGYEESGLFEAGVQDIMSTCPTSPLFWAPYASAEIGSVTGEDATIDGRPATKADITDMVGLAGGLGLVDGFEDANVNEMAMWFDKETGVALALIADIGLPEDALEDLGAAAGGGALGMVMEFSVEQVNDPSLTVETP